MKETRPSNEIREDKDEVELLCKLVFINMLQVMWSDIWCHSGILHLALGGHGGHGHQADRNTKRVWGRWGPLLPAHPPIIISLVSPLLVDPALALQHVAVSLLNCSLGGHNHTEALLYVSVLLQRWARLSCVTDAIRSLSQATIRNHKRAERCYKTFHSPQDFPPSQSTLGLDC